MRRFRPVTLLAALLLFLIGSDHLTKHLAITRLRGHAPIYLVPGIADLRYVENRDIGFSLLRAVPPQVRMPLIIIGSALGIGFICYMWWRNRHVTPLLQVAFAMLVAGAIGNLIDRLARGFVVDMMHVIHWPVFNVADAWLVIGVALLFFGDLQKRKPQAEAGPGAPSSPAP